MYLFFKVQIYMKFLNGVTLNEHCGRKSIYLMEWHNSVHGYYQWKNVDFTKVQWLTVKTANQKMPFFFLIIPHKYKLFCTCGEL